MNYFKTKVQYNGDKSVTIHIVDGDKVITKHYSNVSKIDVSYHNINMLSLRPRLIGSETILSFYQDFFRERYVDEERTLIEQRYYNVFGQDMVGKDMKFVSRYDDMLVFSNDERKDSQKSVAVYDNRNMTLAYKSPQNTQNITLITCKSAAPTLMVEDSNYSYSTFSLQTKNTPICS